MGMPMPDPDVPQDKEPSKPFYESEKVVKSHLLLGLFTVGSLLLLGASAVGLFCTAGTSIEFDDFRGGVLIVSGLVGLATLIATLIAIYNGATDSQMPSAAATRTFHLVGASTVGSLLLLGTVSVAMYCIMTPRVAIDDGRCAALILPGIAGITAIIAALISLCNGFLRKLSEAGPLTRLIQSLHVPGLFVVGTLLVVATAAIAMYCVVNPSMALVGWRCGALILSGLAGIATVLVTLIATYNGALES